MSRPDGLPAEGAAVSDFRFLISILEVISESAEARLILCETAPY